MVTCSQCQTQNPPERDSCQKCGADLLPLPGTSRRVWGILKAALLGFVIVALALVPLIAWKDDSSAAASKGFSLLILLAGVVVTVRGLIRAVGPSPLYTRYLDRAARHAEIDPPQAMTDFIHGVMLAPVKVRSTISQKLPAKLKTLVAQSDISLASATSGYQSPEGVRKILYSGYTLWARLGESIPQFKRATSVGRRAGVETSQATIHRNKIITELGRIFNDLAATGLAKKLGYCPRCKAVVTCDATGRCICNGKHGPAKGIVYVIPEEEDMFEHRLMQVYAPP